MGDLRKPYERPENRRPKFQESTNDVKKSSLLDEVEKYRMCADQLAQIDCRITSCKFHVNASCTNPSPAITLNEGKTCVCWSQEIGEKIENEFASEYNKKPNSRIFSDEEIEDLKDNLDTYPEKEIIDQGMLKGDGTYTGLKGLITNKPISDIELDPGVNFARIPGHSELQPSKQFLSDFASNMRDLANSGMSIEDVKAYEKHANMRDSYFDFAKGSELFNKKYMSLQFESDISEQLKAGNCIEENTEVDKVDFESMRVKGIVNEAEELKKTPKENLEKISNDFDVVESACNSADKMNERDSFFNRLWNYFKF